MNKPISWFEIPALDLPRARAFYQTVLGVELMEHPMGNDVLAVFPYDRDHATGGCVIQGSHYHPSRDGVTIYLNAGEALDPVLDRVKSAGGAVALEKTALPPGMGVYAHVVDTEGNRVGFHAAA